MFEIFSSHGAPLFLGMVFVAVFLLVNSLMVPTFGVEPQRLRRLRSRMAQIVDEFEDETGASLLWEKRRRTSSPLGRWLENLPGISALNLTIEQAGSDMPAHRLVLHQRGA